MFSDRLRYQPVEQTSLDAFHSLVIDEHVRRYLMDGNLFSREWSEERIRESIELFERRGVGIWLVHHKTSHELVGFCGFLEIPATHPDPQLVYAMFERFSGRGFATEMARTVIAEARSQPGFEEIVAGVDEINGASLRILEKLGFERFETKPGSFGNMHLLRLTNSL
jgi:ribosomal-protein-alanine N-acetyltransferase